MTLNDYAAKAHKDSKDVGMGFITWYFQGDCSSSNQANFERPVCKHNGCANIPNP